MPPVVVGQSIPSKKSLLLMLTMTMTTTWIHHHHYCRRLCYSKCAAPVVPYISTAFVSLYRLALTRDVCYWFLRVRHGMHSDWLLNIIAILLCTLSLPLPFLVSLPVVSIRPLDPLAMLILVPQPIILRM